MDLDPEEIDIDLRTATEVGRRMVALSAVVHLLDHPDDDLGGQEVDDEGDDDAETAYDLAAERFDWFSWLTQEGLSDALTSSERALLTPRATSALTDQDVGDEGAAGEALGALAWAVRRSDLTVLDRGYPYLAFLDLVPSPWDGTASFLASLVLRPEPEIAAAREAAEVLLWRAQVEIERRIAKGGDRTGIEAAIRDVAAEAAAAGVAQVGGDGDLVVAGESIRTLSDAVVVSMAAAARARLRAMGWLCGLGDWDDPVLTEI